MDVFNLDRALLSDYERFDRSFTQIKSADIRAQVEAIYASNLSLCQRRRMHSRICGASWRGGPRTILKHCARLNRRCPSS